MQLRTAPKFPEKAMALFKPAPYKVFKGGRGGAKSWSFIRALLILGRKKKLFILCAREIQMSIAESVHKLIADQIEHPDMQMGYFYDILDTEIVGKNGTRFVFAGIRNNIRKIKSYEGIDICACFEANGVPEASWIVLDPTVRRDPPFGPFGQGSEMWVEFNPELATDATYKYWVADPPKGTIIVDINWRDNPWFPERLRAQKDSMKRKDEDLYRTVWEGKTRKTISGAIYAKELGAGIMEERIGPHVKPVKNKGTIFTFDLGDADMTSVWGLQQVGNEHNAVYFKEDCGEDITYFLKWIQDLKCLVSGIWLPHDARQSHQSARGLKHNTIEKQAKAVYPSAGIVKIIPMVRKVMRINALRALFPRLNINDVVCADGIQALTHYQFDVDPETKERSKEPLHNWASHAADSLGGYAVGLREGEFKDKQNAEEQDPYAMNTRSSGGNPYQSWMN